MYIHIVLKLYNNDSLTSYLNRMSDYHYIILENVQIKRMLL